MTAAAAADGPDDVPATRTAAHHKKGPPSWAAPFLDRLQSTANVSAACRLAGIGRRTAYDFRQRDGAFAKRWDNALDDALDLVEAEARRRAVHGVERPVFHAGEQIGTVRVYSDLLLMFLLKAHRPEKYRDNYDITKLVNRFTRSRSTDEHP